MSKAPDWPPSLAPSGRLVGPTCGQTGHPLTRSSASKKCKRIFSGAFIQKPIDQILGRIIGAAAFLFYMANSAYPRSINLEG